MTDKGPSAASLETARELDAGPLYEQCVHGDLNYEGEVKHKAECDSCSITVIAIALDAVIHVARKEALGQAADVAKECHETHMSIHAGHYNQSRCIERTIRALMEAE